MKVRKYKKSNYSAVYLEEISIQAFKTSFEKYKEIKSNERHVVIRPTKKAVENFSKLHSKPLNEFKKGESFRILGVLFKVAYFEQGFVYFSYYNREGKKEVFAPFVTQTTPIGAVLIETLFNYTTGKLLYF